MKLIADAMLGRLAKWLRLLGFDILYYPDISDRQILRIALEQDRTVLTRDTNLIRRKNLKNYIFIKSDDISGQLNEVKEILNIRGVAPSRRCPRCNGVLSEWIRKNDIRDAVPEYVYHYFNYFIKCKDCGKVYWEGTHQKRFREKIEEILNRACED